MPIENYVNFEKNQPEYMNNLTLKCLILISLIAAQVYTIKIYGQNRFINFNSTQEKEYFNLVDNNKNLLKLSLLADIDEISANENVLVIDSYINQLNWSDSDHTKPTKKLKSLFKNIHNTFLKIYDEDANTYDMFESGKYNCVTASVLYSYIFEYIDIPYQIKEEPTHVYVIAYPDKHNIMIETTTPTMGVFAPNTKAKTEYIKTLVANKYLEQSYVDNVGIEKAFNEFFYGKTNISFKELIGLLYYNKAVNYINDKEAIKSYSDIYKANFLYPAKKHQFLEQEILKEYLDNFSFDQLDEWEILLKVLNNEDTEVLRRFFIAKFNEKIHKYLWVSHQKENLDSIFNYTSVHLLDSVLKKENSYNYYYEVARYYLASKNYDLAESNLSKVYEINPSSLMTHTIIKSFIAGKIGNSFTEANLNYLTDYTVKYPFLKDDKEIISYYIHISSILAYNSFNDNKEEQGIKYFNLVLNKLENHNNIPIHNEKLIEELFLGVSAMYYMKNNKSRGKEILATAVRLYPHITRLNDTLKMLK